MVENLLKLMEINSTSGNEAGLAYFISDNFKNESNAVELQEVGDGTFNVFIKWGIPKVIFCTHLDTVPPYIPPKVEGEIIYGRGACDAKGQIASMFEACLELQKEGNSGFGLLLLAGEEVGSKGAKIANKLIEGCEYVIVGEPTENKIIRAGKGTKQFEVVITGKSAHSGYPHLGDDAIERFRKFLNELADIDFPQDDILGETTYNISGINAPNAVNVVPEHVFFRIYFRTTFKSDRFVTDKLMDFNDEKIKVTLLGGDAPINFETLGYEGNNIVSYGSDAPVLTNLGKRMLYGPGSIFYAHTENEQVSTDELYKAVNVYKSIYYKIKKQIN
ncbi:MAG: M20/M25/M40 family metallo-hydrolase [Deltaproteobacteria bacterium]